MAQAGPFSNPDFCAYFASSALIEEWSSQSDGDETEEQSDYDEVDGIQDVVFRPDEGFNELYSHTDGLGALPRNTQTTRSSAPPLPTTAHLAGGAEVSLKKALKCERTRLLATSAREDERTQKSGLDFFAGWEQLTEYMLPSAGNLVEELQDKKQREWQDAKVDIQVLGQWVGLEGWFGIIRRWLTPTDWLSLYRAQARVIHCGYGRDMDKKEDRNVISNIESQLFDTTKYNGDSNYMTVITYGDGYYGTISLFRATIQTGPKAVAGMFDIMAYAEQVPKRILKSMKTPNRIEYVQKDGKIRCVQAGGQFMPSPVNVTTRTKNRKNKQNIVQWSELGESWRSALGIAHQDGDDDGLLATIPQMLTLLHLKGYALHNLHSSPVQQFKEPLVSVPYAVDDDVAAEPAERTEPGFRVERGIQITDGPERRGHPGRRLKIITLFPPDSPWANEQLLWA